MNAATILGRALVTAVLGCAIGAAEVRVSAGQPQSAAVKARPAPAEKPKFSPQQTMDLLFLEHAAQSAMANDQLGRLAAKRGDYPAVKRFGMEVVEFARTSTLELNDIAKEAGIFLPETLVAEEQGVINRIKLLEGKPFDKQVMAEIWSQNTRDRSLFLRISTQAHDPKLKTWGTKALHDAETRQAEVKELALRVAGAPPAAKSGGR